MTNYVVTSYFTTLDFPSLAAFDTVSITSIGGIFAPTLSLNGGGSNILHIAGAVELHAINLIGDDALRITSTGSVYSASYDAAITTGSGSSGSVVDNAGSVTSAWGTAVSLSGTSDILRNAGQVTGYLGVQIGYYGDMNQTLVNSGTISGTSTGVMIAGGLAKVLNTGLIESGLNAAINISGEYNGATTVATQQDVTNHGTIATSSHYGIYVVLNLPESYFTLTNSGTISAQSFAVISLGQSRDIVTNTGTIMGGVDLGGGDDSYFGQGGTLTRALFLGSGDDFADLRGGTVSDFVYGGAGSDVFYLSDSATVLIEGGDLDTDTVHAACNYRMAANIELLLLLDGGAWAGAGNSGGNGITGNASDNRLSGLDGFDTLSGNLGDDRLAGGNDDDSLRGDEGDDTLIGGTGLDTLRGGDGDDRLTGGAAKDNLGGDAGADIFVFANLAQSSATAGAWDTVVDFDRGNDLIDLSAIDARSTNAAPNDAFAFIGTAAFSAAGQVRYVVAGPYVLVEMDATGDGVADSVIRLNGLSAVGAGDFIL